MAYKRKYRKGEKITSLDEFYDTMVELWKAPKREYDYIVIDTVDWLVRLIVEKVAGIDKHHLDETLNRSNGGYGNGKTYLAASVANALLDKGYTCRFVNFADAENELSDMRYGKRDYVNELKDCDLLIVDDLGAERDTEYMQSKVYSVINQRCNAQKPIIITTNLSREQLLKQDDERQARIVDRLFGMTIPINVSSKSMRRTILNKHYEKYKDILHLPGKGE